MIPALRRNDDPDSDHSEWDSDGNIVYNGALGIGAERCDVHPENAL